MQRRMTSDQVADIITTWDTDDELSSDEENAVPELLPSNSPAASSAVIGSQSSDEDESDNDGTTSMRGANAGNIVSRNRTI